MRNRRRSKNNVGLTIAVVALGIPCFFGLAGILSCLLFVAARAYGIN